MRSKLLGFCFIFFLILIWEAYSLVGESKVFFPSFIDILIRLSYILTTEEYWIHIIYTITRCLLGFTGAVLISIPFGLLLGRYKFIHDLFEVFIEFFRPMPSSALIPVSILFLGIENEMKIFIIFFGSSWPILINTIDGVVNINPMMLDTAKVFRLSKLYIFRKVIFPAILPQIFTGLRISIAIALILSITVEMIIGGNGIGYFILDAERSFHFIDMYSGVITIGIIGYLINFAFRKIENRILYWT